MEDKILLDIISSTVLKAFIKLDCKTTGFSFNHFDEVSSLAEQLQDPAFLQSFEVVGNVIVPTYDTDQDDIVFVPYSLQSFVEKFK